jgi:hypothetical protein
MLDSEEKKNDCLEKKKEVFHYAATRISDPFVEGWRIGASRYIYTC